MKHIFADGLEPTTNMELMIRTGALRIVSDGIVTIDANEFTCCWVSQPQIVALTFEDPTSVVMESCLALTDLEVSELVAVVDYHDVATNAGTKAGLIKAIERELDL